MSLHILNVGAIYQTFFRGYRENLANSFRARNVLPNLLPVIRTLNLASELNTSFCALDNGTILH